MYERLTPDQEGQIKFLKSVRAHHQELLIGSGLLERVITADVGMNPAPETVTVNPNTQLFVMRKQIQNQPSSLLESGDDSLRENCRYFNDIDEDFAETVKSRFPNSHLLSIGVLNVVPGNFRSTNLKVGLELVPYVFNTLSDVELVPLDNIESGDVLTVATMLKEMDLYRLGGDLSCLNPETLTNISIDTGLYTPVL